MKLCVTFNLHIGLNQLVHMVFGVWMTTISFLSCGVADNSEVSVTVDTKTPIRLFDITLDHKYLRPKAIHDPEVLDEFSKDYMYLSCISFINSIKTASLRWHSPMLDDISAVKTWEKVNEGMKKMFVAEVLGKLPVMQHALFGSLLPFPTPEEDPELKRALEEEGQPAMDAHGHIHDPSEKGWSMDCCGIPGMFVWFIKLASLVVNSCTVPSAFAAAQNANTLKGVSTLSNRPGIKPIPFD